MDFERIYRDFLALAKIGENADGSVTRELFSDSYKEAVAAADAYLKRLGFSTFTDPCMNLHGVWRCGKPGAKTIYLGSHLDTVKAGGLFDGPLGFITAAEAAAELIRSGEEINCDLHVLGTNGEEGNVLGGTFGSRCLCGLTDVDQPGFLEKAAAFGLTRQSFADTVTDYKDAKAWLELHIEQGSTLEMNREDIGIVTGIVGLERYVINVRGESNHAGTTMMEYRKDALVGAAKLITKIDALAREYGNQMVATVGTLEVTPGAITVIPENVRMVLEIRNLSSARLANFIAEIKAFAATVPYVTFDFETMVKKDPSVCDEAIGKYMEESCRARGFSLRRLPSGATHDGTSMSTRMPIAMIFVPSVNGVSHCKEEFTPWPAAEKGMLVFCDTLKALVK